MFLTFTLLGFVCASFSAAEDVKVLKKHTYYNTTIDRVILYEVNLEQIELEAFKDVDLGWLQISANSLKGLRKGIFVNTSIHYKILLDENNINTIEPGTFHDFHYELKGDEMISLNYNKLRSIEKGVFTNTTFAFLFLSGNRIRYIEPGSFDGMSYFRQLDLSYNLLETIDVGVFQNLPAPSHDEYRAYELFIYLRENKIRFIDEYAFENSSLYGLDLSLNRFRPLDKKYFKNSAIQYLRLN